MQIVWYTILKKKRKEKKKQSKNERHEKKKFKNIKWTCCNLHSIPCNCLHSADVDVGKCNIESVTFFY